MRWDEQAALKSIAVKESIPIIVATVVWGSEWKGRRVSFHCDNSAVAVLKSRSSRDQDLMQPLRCLFFFEAKHQFQLSFTHIAGIDNERADDLSRDRLAGFKARIPWVDDHPTDIPPLLLQWLLRPHQDWTSQSWIQQFGSFAGEVWLNPHKKPTPQH